MNTLKQLLTAFFEAMFTDPFNKRVCNIGLLSVAIFFIVQFVRFKLQN